jgi:hypothetical protein
MALSKTSLSVKEEKDYGFEHKSLEISYSCRESKLVGSTHPEDSAIMRLLPKTLVVLKKEKTSQYQATKQ